jgi:hypothetical protein
LTHGADIAAHDPAGGPPSAAQGFVAVVVTGIVLVLMALAPVATRAAPLEKGWWVEPSTWPLLCLSLALAAAGWQAAGWVRAAVRPESRAAALGGAGEAFAGLVPTFAYAALFCLYLLSVAWAGFAVASLLFLQVVLHVAGLRSGFWRLTGLLFVIAVILVFRVGLGLWFPMAPLFALFPDWFVDRVAIHL